MIVPRYEQRTLFETAVCLMLDHRDLLWDNWMMKVDEILDEEKVLAELVQSALEERRPKSKNRGRIGTPAEVVLRLLILKHLKDWSYDDLEKEVRANIVYRDFTRIGGNKVPDAKTMIKISKVLDSNVIRQINEKIVDVAKRDKVCSGRKMRVDTTVTETNIHYPTDSGLLSDTTRVLTRTMKRIQKLTNKAGSTLRDRSRSVKLRVFQIARSARMAVEERKTNQKAAYQKLMTIVGRILSQAETFVREVSTGIKKATTPVRQMVLNALMEQLKDTSQLTRRVLNQTKARILKGDTHYKDKIFSIFEEHTEAIRKGKLSKPTEFGKMIKIQEAENQIITDYEVYQKRPYDVDLLQPAVLKHIEVFQKPPHLLATDAGFFSAKNEAMAQQQGVKWVAIPNRNTRDPQKRKNQKKRWFRKAQRWRTGCEGRISVIKRRHGLSRCRDRGMDGMNKWVGLGILANNLIAIGKKRAERQI